jgi:hypothetical protein
LLAGNARKIVELPGLAEAGRWKMVMMIASKDSQAGMARKALLLLMMMVLFAVDAWAQAGYIHASSGPVMIQSASGVPVALTVG